MTDERDAWTAFAERRGLVEPASGGPRRRRRRDEAEFEDRVVELAKATGWKVLHIHDSRAVDWRSDPGWPDWVLCRPPDLIVVELKSETGRVRKGQRQWVDALVASGAEACFWRPGDWDAIEARLR